MSDIVERLRTFLGNGIGEDAAKEIEALRKRLAESQTKLVECQAREKVLRDALDTLDMHFPESAHRLECERMDALVTNARNLPSDSTALDSTIKQAKREALLKLEGL